MRLWTFFSFHITSLLLIWRCSRASGNPETNDDELNQMATASFVRPRNTTGNDSTLERPFTDVDITTVRYENSNGFVPMRPEIDTVTRLGEAAGYAENIGSKKFSKEKHLSLFFRDPKYSKKEKSIENDPFYSSEARLFLSLIQPIHNRRSSDPQKSSDEFELLKINENTPSVADFKKFYNSFTGTNKNFRNGEREAGNKQTQFYDNGQNLDDGKNVFANGGRSKKMGNNLYNYGENVGGQNQKNQFLSYYQMSQNQNKNKYNGFSNVKNSFSTPVNFDYSSQKPVNNLPTFYPKQHDVTSYDLNQKINSPTEVTLRQRHPRIKSSHNFHRPKTNVKQFGSTKAKVASNLDNGSVQSQSHDSNPCPDETVRYFKHEALFNREERNHNYDQTEEGQDVSEENYEYIEITEKPRRFRKQKKRPSYQNDSTRLPKEHRDAEDSDDLEETEKPKTRIRSKIRGHKTKVDTWLEHETPTHEDESDEENFDATAEGTANSESKRQRFKNQNHKSKDNTWTNVSPNVEISHSSGLEIGKPKVVVPVKVNLVPLGTFDHATTLGNSQGFDLSNAVLRNFVTATPVTFADVSAISPTILPILNTPGNIFSQNIGKSLQNLQDQNLKIQTPNVIVGQNSFQNPVQTIFIPQQNYQNPTNTFLPNGQNSYAQNSVVNPSSQAASFNAVQQNSASQNIHGHLPVQNLIYNPNQNTVQNYQNFNGNQVQNVQTNSQVNNPHPTSQTLENYPQNNGQSAANYNVKVNPIGLHGQNLPNVHLFNPQNVASYSTTPSNYVHNGNLNNADNQGKKNVISGNNGQFLASASFAVGGHNQNQINSQNSRPQLHQNFHQTFADIKNSSGPLVFKQDHQSEQISQASNSIAQTYKDQNQQIIKVANEIFETTLKQLKQLQKSQNFRTNNKPGNQNSQNLDNGKIIESHTQNGGTKNVEIINPNIRPSVVDQSFKTPFENYNTFGKISFTTPFPFLSTTDFYTSPQLQTPATIGPLSIRGYVNSLTEIGAKENDLKTSPTTNSKPSSPTLYNPINFVPNLETLQAQKALNTKYSVQEPTNILQGLNLVPLVPGGNFFKNSYLPHDDLISKPKLSSDLQKYAEEMFKESLKTIYNTHKWNNDHKGEGSEISAVTTSPKVKDDFRNFKLSPSDIKPSKQILEAHFTEPGSKDPKDQSPKKPQNLEFTDILKPGSKQPPPISFEPVRFYYKPNIHFNKPTIADLNHPDFKFDSELGPGDYLHDFLVPPKPNAFISKIPFSDVIPKRRPPRVKKPVSDPGKGKVFGRPDIGLSRPSAGVVEGASSVAHHSFSFDAPRHKYLYKRPPFDQENQDFENDYQNSYSGLSNFYSRYPSLTTSSPNSEDHHKQNGNKYDFNHQRMHNLMGLLRKNKRLPSGSTKGYFEKMADLERQFENREIPAEQIKFFENSSSGFAEKADVRISETSANLTQNY